MKSKGFLKYAVSMLSMIGALAGGSQALAQGSKKSETLSIAIGSEFETLNPMIASQAATNYMLYLAHRPLVILDLDSKWVAHAIKTMPTLENKMAKIVGEGLELRFEILDELEWGDKTPVTCKDVELAWQIGKSPNVSIANREPYENITAITWDPAKPKACTMKFAKKKYDYFANLPAPMPSHLEGAVFEKTKDKPQGYDQATLYTKDPANPGLYFGPYRLSEVKLGSHVIFVENTNWKGKKPFFKKIIFKLLPNNGTHIANLKSDNVQMIAPGSGIGLDQAIAFEKEVKAQNLPYKVIYEEGQVYAHIDFNLDHPILSDARVRKAIAHGFDRKEIINSLISGKATPALHPYPPRDPWFTSDVPDYRYSRRQAEKLLDEAGWKVGPKGIRQKDGKDLRLTLHGGAGVKLVEMIQTYIQEQLKKIGVEIIVKGEPGRVFFGETVPKRKFEMAFFSWVSVPESSPRSVLHSSKIPSEANNWGGQNSMGWRNKEVDALIDQLESEMNAGKRAAIGKKIAKAYANDLPVLPMYFRMNNVVIPAAMKGYRLSGHQYFESLYAENWSY